MDRAELKGTAAVLLVADVNKTAEWYREKLGFNFEQFYGDPHDFCIMGRDDNYIMFSNCSDKDRIIPNWKIVGKTSNVYFWVNDAEMLYKEFLDRGADIDYSLYITDYNVKEFGVTDPDGYDISFGEIIK
ncbi:MAG: bleomycin resistance protein [Bacteroidetes bacterium]|nr:bleomycin resistance protein [Bacteroidota bacterium]